MSKAFPRIADPSALSPKAWPTLLALLAAPLACGSSLGTGFGDDLATTPPPDAATTEASVPRDLALSTDGTDSDGSVADAPPADLSHAVDLLAPDLSSPDLAASALSSRDLAPAPDLVSGPRRVFAGPVHDGNFGGFAGADAHCQAAATAAALPGRYKAILGSTDTAPFSTIFLDTGSDILRPDRVKVATDDTFWSTSHLVAISVLADGSPAGGACVWTAFGPTGGGSPQSCAGWTRASATDNAQVGDQTRSDLRWYLDRFESCDRPCHVYCIAQ